MRSSRSFWSVCVLLFLQTTPYSNLYAREWSFDRHPVPLSENLTLEERTEVVPPDDVANDEFCIEYTRRLEAIYRRRHPAFATVQHLDDPFMFLRAYVNASKDNLDSTCAASGLMLQLDQSWRRSTQALEQVCSLRVGKFENRELQALIDIVRQAVIADNMNVNYALYNYGLFLPSIRLNDDIQYYLYLRLKTLPSLPASSNRLENGRLGLDQVRREFVEKAARHADASAVLNTTEPCAAEKPQP